MWTHNNLFRKKSTSLNPMSLSLKDTFANVLQLPAANVDCTGWAFPKVGLILAAGRRRKSALTRLESDGSVIRDLWWKIKSCHFWMKYHIFHKHSRSSSVVITILNKWKPRPGYTPPCAGDILAGHPGPQVYLLPPYRAVLMPRSGVPRCK